MKFITILQGGSLGTPNLYYIIYGRPLIEIDNDNATVKNNDNHSLSWQAIRVVARILEFYWDHSLPMYQKRVHIFTIQSYALAAIKLTLIENSLYYISMIYINEI